MSVSPDEIQEQGTLATMVGLVPMEGRLAILALSMG